jgi:putative ABC transport system permease protein
MSRLTGWLYFLRALVRRNDADRDMAEEIAFHVDRQTRKHESRGLSHDDARRRALQEFGGTTRWREEAREARAGAAIDVVEQDLRYAARGLMRRPGFTAVAVLTLAIGIGGTTAIFSAVNALLLRRLPYAAPEQLMSVSLTMPAIGGLRARDDMVWSYAEYTVFRDAQSVFSDLSLYTPPQRFTVTSGAVELVQGEFVGARYLRTLGLAPVQGRDFDPSIDAHAGAERQVIISYGLWQRRYNADPSIVGKMLDLDADPAFVGADPDPNRKPYMVVGVAPAGFRGLTGQADVFIPLTTRPANDLVWYQAAYHQFFMVARRKPDIGTVAAISAVKLLGARVQDATSKGHSTGTGWGATARPLSDIRVSPLIRRALLVAFGAVALVLLIACVNVANLLLGRASTRRREMAVRLALGAARSRLVRLLLAESLLLAALGGLAGIAVAWLGVHALSTLNSDTIVPRGDALHGLGAVTFAGVHLDWGALAFSLPVTLFVGLVFGLVPALQATGASLTDSMKLTAGDGDVRHRGAGARRVLVVVEVALAMLLLVGSGLLLRSFGKLVAIDPGFDARHVLTMRLTIPPSELSESSMPAFYTQLLERVRALPGVVDASLNSCPPLGGGCFRSRLEFPDRPTSDDTRIPIARVSWTTPTWFATMHVRLERGRLFADTDRSGAPEVAIVNEAAARTFWPGEDAIGKRVGILGGNAAVVGIVADVRQYADSLAKPDVYLAYAQSPSFQMMLFVRTAGEPLALAGDVHRAIRELAPHYPIHDIQSMTARAAGATAQSRLSTALLSLFAATALALTVVGIYGVMGLAVTSRTREIGIRIALGADQRELRRQVVGEGMMLASIGAAIGLAGALAATRVLQTLLFELSPTDPITYGAMVVLIGVATAAASWVPARRAARVDPVVALRAD